jgi:hypothetical protein
VRRHSQKALACGALLLLAACGTTQQSAVAPAACPQVLLVGETSPLTRFQPGAGRDPTDVVMQARIADYKGVCTLDASKNVTVDLTLLVEATRGPANRDRRGSYDFFVALTDKTDAFRSQRVFPAEVTFGPDVARLEMVEELTQTIPLRAGEAPADYSIYVGFELTDAERAFNRARLRR